MQESVFSRPDAEMSQRESVETFEVDVLPAYQNFVEELSQYSGSPVLLDEPSRYAPLESKLGIFWLPAIILDTTIPCDIVVSVGNKHFLEAGLTNFSQEPDSDRYALQWSNPTHGGYVSITSTYRLYAWGESGNRPTENPGRTQSDHIPSPWEQALPWNPASEYKPPAEWYKHGQTPTLNLSPPRQQRGGGMFIQEW